MRRPFVILAACLPACITACDAITPGVVCTAESRSTLTVVAHNAVSGSNESGGATVIVKNAAVYDSVVAPAAASGDVAYRGWEDRIRGGLYQVTVRKPGFTEWTASVKVDQDQCHSGPGPLVDAKLQPIASAG